MSQVWEKCQQESLIEDSAVNLFVRQKYAFNVDKL